MRHPSVGERLLEECPEKRHIDFTHTVWPRGMPPNDGYDRGSLGFSENVQVGFHWPYHLCNGLLVFVVGSGEYDLYHAMRDCLLVSKISGCLLNLIQNLFLDAVVWHFFEWVVGFDSMGLDRVCCV